MNEAMAYSWNVNNVEIAGRCIDDPVVFKLDSGKKNIKFTLLCVKRNRKKSGGFEDEQLKIRCEGWNQIANNLRTFLRHGTQLLVMGHIKKISRDSEMVLVIERYLPGPNVEFLEEEERCKQINKKNKNFNTTPRLEDMYKTDDLDDTVACPAIDGNV